MDKCLFCGKEFEPVGGGIRKKKFCSPACRSKYHCAKQKEQLDAEQEDRTCPFCGKVFKVRKTSNKIYCSIVCKEAYAEITRNQARKEAFKIVRSQKELSEEELINRVQSLGYIVVKEHVETETRVKVKDFKGDKKITIGIVSDTHIGSKQQQLTYLQEFYSYAEKKVDFFIHSGDLLEGSGSLYKGQHFEMFLHGADAQVDYAIRNYPKSKKKTYLVGGNHDYSFFKSVGFDVLRVFADARNDIEYLGYAGAYLEIGAVKIYIMHPDGGIAYAVSYRLQKIIEQFAPEEKPHILICGHYHKPCHIPMYRNVEGFLTPCFQSQTPYLKRKGVYPAIAGQIIEIEINSEGLVSVKNMYYPFYHPRHEDF